MDKRMASILGIALGVVILIVGFSVMGPEQYTIGDPFMKFGADFYTEIYDVTRAAGLAVQTAYENICNAIGWLIVAIGLSDIAYFVCKLVSANDEGVQGVNDTSPAPASPAPIVITAQNERRTAPVTEYPSAPPATGGWTCACGRNHAAYEMSCVCGLTKAEAKAQKNSNNE